jgi:imidazolonepropionase-like amidohydrolase
MQPSRLLACSAVLGVIMAASLPVQPAFAQANPAIIYEGARLIIGPASAVPIENGTFIVETGVITAIGSSDEVNVLAGAARVDLSGKTVMPAMVDVHAHLGYEKYTDAAGDSRSEHYTAENLLDHFERSAYYGVGTVNDGGSAVVPLSLQFQADQRSGKYPPAAHYVFNPGVVPPEGGPDHILIRGTRPLNANYEVTTPEAARAAVRDIAAKGIRHLKIWIGDRAGTYPAMSAEVSEAVLDEAHKHGIEVHAHATSLRDQKDIVAAGVDLLVHMVDDEDLDDAFLELLAEKKPYWVPVIGNGLGPGLIREVCNNEPFATETLSPFILAEIMQADCGGRPDEVAVRAWYENNFAKMIGAGARIVLGTDAGVRPSKTFGTSAHHELAIFVGLGLSEAEAIEAATARAAEVLGLPNVGVLAQGKDADFIVLDANPLENILNTRKISAVYLSGSRLDRDALLAQWNGAGGQN